MKTTKIGLCLAFKGTNYGQNLQALATQRIIDSLGYDTEIIDYQSGKDKGIKFSFATLYFAGQYIFQLICKRLKSSTKLQMDEVHEKNITLRKKASDNFRDEYFHSIRQVNGFSNLEKISDEYGAVLVGSDQIWTPGTAFTNFYTLRFAKAGVKRISYAPSLGVSEYPNYAKKSAADYWKQIDYLSVREKQGKEIIKSIVDIPVEVVADPTYLFTANEWENIIPPEEIVESGYVLCYFLGDDDKAKDIAKKYAKDHNLRCVSILSNECNAKDNGFDDIVIGKSPADFVNLIRYAECVFTDSFHGLAFSVINKKQFYVFYRVRKDVKVQRNSRIDNILSLWGLEKRLIVDYVMPKEEMIDYSIVHKKVDALRHSSLEFLTIALNSVHDISK